jgi:hypothetical protein
MRVRKAAGLCCQRNRRTVHERTGDQRGLLRCMQGTIARRSRCHCRSSGVAQRGICRHDRPQVLFNDFPCPLIPRFFLAPHDSANIFVQRQFCRQLVSREGIQLLQADQRRVGQAFDATIWVSLLSFKGRYSCHDRNDCQEPKIPRCSPGNHIGSDRLEQP